MTDGAYLTPGETLDVGMAILALLTLQAGNNLEIPKTDFMFKCSIRIKSEGDKYILETIRQLE